MTGWHETVLILSLVGIVFFYAHVFVRIASKASLLAAITTLLTTGVLLGLVTELVSLSIVIGAVYIPLFHGHGFIFYRVFKHAINGSMEELFRSIFVVVYAKIKRKQAVKKNKVNYSHIKTLDNQVLGLAFLYGILESGRMTLQVFPSLLAPFRDYTLNVDIVGTSQLVNTHPIYVIIFACAMVLRYYIHLCFLQFSVYSLAAGRKRLYLLSLFFHFSAGAIFGLFGAGTIEHVVISILVIEVIFVGGMTFLLSKLNLREQIIANNTNQSA